MNPIACCPTVSRLDLPRCKRRNAGLLQWISPSATIFSVARRAELARVVEKSGLLLSLQLPGDVADVVNAVRAMHLEGVIAKRRDSPYEVGERSNAWQKLKLERQQEFVIGGYRPAGA